MTQLRSVTRHMGSHSVTCYPTQVNAPRLHHSQTGWYSIYRPFKGGGLSKPRPRVQRATGPLLLRDHLRPAGLEPRLLDRKSSTLTTRQSRLSPEHLVSVLSMYLGLASFAVTSGVPHRLCPIPETLQLHQVGGRGAQPTKSCRKTTKRTRDDEDPLTQRKKPAKQNTNRGLFDICLISYHIISYHIMSCRRSEMAELSQSWNTTDKPTIRTILEDDATI